MIDELRRTVTEHLDELDGVVGLRRTREGVAPHVFQKGDDLSELEIAPRHPLATVVSRLQSAYPHIRLGIVARGCDERAYIEMAKRNQIDPARLVILGFACTADDAETCHCQAPYPRNLLVGTPSAPGSRHPMVAKYDTLSLAERDAFWQRQFAKCIKCYGCRNICPECFCEDCALENAAWVEPGLLAPPFPMFHLIRAMHMASRCVACRQCDLVCPAHIPLTVLYDLMRQDMETMLDYVPGADLEATPPLSTTLDDTPVMVDLGHLL